MSSQIRRYRSANGRRDRFCRQVCYRGFMELVLIILGGALSTAIIFMIVDGLRGTAPEDEDAISPTDPRDQR